MGDLYAFRMKALDGKERSLAEFKGKVLLIVNVASFCGYTPHYRGMQKLHEKYRGQGFEVLGFPSNDFAQEEPGSDAEIAEFCASKYQVSFPMFSKIEVSGEKIHPLFKYLTESGFPGPVEWNFAKFLVDRKGTVVGRFHPKTKPESPEIIAAIEGALRS